MNWHAWGVGWGTIVILRNWNFIWHKHDPQMCDWLDLVDLTIYVPWTGEGKFGLIWIGMFSHTFESHPFLSPASILQCLYLPFPAILKWLSLDYGTRLPFSDPKIGIVIGWGTNLIYSHSFVLGPLFTKSTSILHPLTAILNPVFSFSYRKSFGNYWTARGNNSRRSWKIVCGTS